MSTPKVLVTFKSGYAFALAPAGEAPTKLTVEDGRLYKKAIERCYPSMYVLGVTSREAGQKPTMMLRIGPQNEEGVLGGQTTALVLLTPTDLQEMTA